MGAFNVLSIRIYVRKTGCKLIVRQQGPFLSTRIEVCCPSVVSKRTPLEFYLIPKYHIVFINRVRRGNIIDSSQIIFDVGDVY